MLFQDKTLLKRSKQEGAAVIVALFVVALVAAMATVMIERLRTDIRRTELTLDANSIFLYAQGSLLWAADTLNNNLKHQQPNKVVDRTPILSPPETKNGITISTIIYDAQGFFNINNLTDTQYQTNFSRLLQLVAPGTSAEQAQNITAAVIDWISPAKNPSLGEIYLKSDPAYRAPHNPMASISELRLVNGMTANLFNKLSPYLIALPKTTQININNASIPVLMSLSMSLTADSAKALTAACLHNPFPTTQAFLNFDIVKNNPFDANKITVTSSYFLVKTNVTLGQQTLVLYTLLERTGQGAQITTNVLWQSIGTL